MIEVDLSMGRRKKSKSTLQMADEVGDEKLYEPAAIKKRFFLQMPRDGYDRQDVPYAFPLSSLKKMPSLQRGKEMNSNVQDATPPPRDRPCVNTNPSGPRSPNPTPHIHSTCQNKDVGC